MAQSEYLTFLSPGVLMMMTSITLLIWYVKYRWNRRHLFNLIARIPGPKGYPLIGNALSFFYASKKDAVNKFVKMCEDYPGLCKIWIGPKLFVVITDPTYIEYVVNNPDCLAKDTFYEVTRMYIGMGLFAAPVHIWKKNRKIINPTFSQKILNTFIPSFNRNSDNLVNWILKCVGGKDVKILKLSHQLTLHTLSETIMGFTTKLETKISTDRYAYYMDKTMGIVMQRYTNIVYFSDFLFNLTVTARKLRHYVRKLKAFTESLVQEKRRIFYSRTDEPKNDATNGDSNLFKSTLDHLLQLSIEGIKLTNQELQDEVNTFMVAGSDTTAVALSFCFLTLGLSSDVQQKVYDEIIEVVGQSADVTLQDLPRLLYTERFIKETLRVFPIAPFFARLSPVEHKLGDYVIPANCTLVVLSIVTHRSPEYWKDPMKFDPDRFLPEEIAKRHPYSYIPFSGGPRGCIGMKYAYMLLKIALTHTVRKYKVHTGYKSVEDVTLSSNLMLRPENGFKLSFELRQ